MRERITAVRCILINKMTIEDAAMLLAKEPLRVSACVGRFEEGGLDPDSLETLPRSDRPPAID